MAPLSFKRLSFSVSKKLECNRSHSDEQHKWQKLQWPPSHPPVHKLEASWHLSATDPMRYWALACNQCQPRIWNRWINEPPLALHPLHSYWYVQSWLSDDRHVASAFQSRKYCSWQTTFLGLGVLYAPESTLQTAQVIPSNGTLTNSVRVCRLVCES